MGRLLPTILLLALISICAGACRAQKAPAPVPAVEDSLETKSAPEPPAATPGAFGRPASSAYRSGFASADGDSVAVRRPVRSAADWSVEDTLLVPEKNARVAMISSLGFPGLGQLYNDEGWKTLLVFTWEAYYIGRIIRDARLADFYKRKADALDEGETWRGLGYEDLRARFNRRIERETDYIWYSGALILASILDAYVFAHLHDFNVDDIRGRRSAVLPLIDHEKRSVGLQFWYRF